MEPKNKMISKAKEFEGTIVSTKMMHTVMVNVAMYHRHPLYKKAIRKTKHFAADIGSFSLTVGDKVRIRETKPMSRTKHFVVIEKI